MIKANYNMHSTACDGSDTLEEVAASACYQGLTHLGFSGHMDAYHEMDIASYYAAVRSLQDKYRGRMDILRGLELDSLYSKECLYDAEYWIGSTHFMDVVSDEPMPVDSTFEQLQDLCSRFYSNDYYRLARAFYDLTARIYDRTGCTFVGHFDLIMRFNDEWHYLDEDNPKYWNYALEAMEYLVSEGVPFEVNTGAVNRGWKKQFYPSCRLLKELKVLGGEVVICSDAHRKEDICGNFGEAVAVMRKCGFTHANILEHGTDGKIQWRQVALDLLCE